MENLDILQLIKDMGFHPLYIIAITFLYYKKFRIVHKKSETKVDNGKHTETNVHVE